MKIEKTNIEGLFVINTIKFEDHRGSLLKPYSYKNYKDFEVNLNFKETWFTKSKANVIRGMHLQIGEMAYEKLVSVIAGSLIDVVLDIRKDSSTYGEFFEIKLDDTLPRALYIPKGCAHGYKVLEDNTITMYKATEVHSSDHDLGVKWDSFGYDWEIEDPIISRKDEILPNFNDI